MAKGNEHGKNESKIITVKEQIEDMKKQLGEIEKLINEGSQESQKKREVALGRRSELKFEYSRKNDYRRNLEILVNPRKMFRDEMFTRISVIEDMLSDRERLKSARLRREEKEEYTRQIASLLKTTPENLYEALTEYKNNGLADKYPKKEERKEAEKEIHSLERELRQISITTEIERQAYEEYRKSLTPYRNSIRFEYSNLRDAQLREEIKNIRKKLKEPGWVFYNLHRMPEEQVILVQEVIENILSNKERKERAAKRAEEKTNADSQLTELNTKLKELEAQLTEYERKGLTEEYLQKESEYDDIKKQIDDIEKMLAQNQMQAEIDEEQAEQYRKTITPEKSRLIAKYNSLNDEELKKERKKITIYMKAKDEIQEILDILSSTEDLKILDYEQRKIEEYFDAYEKRERITFRDKEEYAKMERRYRQIEEQKKKINEESAKKVSQGIDEDELIKEATKKIRYLTNEKNWDKIIEEQEAKSELDNTTGQEPENGLELDPSTDPAQNPDLNPILKERLIDRIKNIGRRISEKYWEISEMFTGVDEDEEEYDDEMGINKEPTDETEKPSEEDNEIDADTNRDPRTGGVFGEYIPWSQRHRILGKIIGKRMDAREAKEMKEIQEFEEMFMHANGAMPTNRDIREYFHPRLSKIMDIFNLSEMEEDLVAEHPAYEIKEGVGHFEGTSKIIANLKKNKKKEESIVHDEDDELSRALKRNGELERQLQEFEEKLQSMRQRRQDFRERVDARSTIEHKPRQPEELRPIEFKGLTKDDINRILKNLEDYSSR